MAYNSIKDLLDIANREKKPVWQVVIEDDMSERQVSFDESFQSMCEMYRAMKEADKGYDGKIKSASLMAGGDGEKLHEYNQTGRNLAGEYLSLVMEKAVKMGVCISLFPRVICSIIYGNSPECFAPALKHCGKA